MKDKLLQNKRYLVLPLDAVLAFTSFYLACVLRFDGFFPPRWETFPGWSEYFHIVAILVSVRAVFFATMGLYRSLWAYASIHDIALILKATAISSLSATVALLFYNRLEGMSRSVLVLDALLLFLLMSFRSFSWRILRDLVFMRKTRNGKRTLIIGAGYMGNRLLMELRTSAVLPYHPLGFLDDSRAKIGGSLQGLPILGSIEQLDSLLLSMHIEQVIIAAKLPGSKVRFIYRTCEARGLGCKTLPPLADVLAQPQIGRAIRDVSLEDLLGRDVVKLETESIEQAMSGKTILISGAGGSIGAEVCRQLASYSPATLILLDAAETPLYDIDYQLRALPNPPQTVSVVGDIRNSGVLHRIFQNYDIQVVFHCAAYKHVPMMELNAGEAVMNNVYGTYVIANAARDAGVERFVMISTDKAVNPVNIMGATKRIAELYIQNLARVSDTKFITVRFGNVLGSNGSVIPLFQKQIAAGGPITVTHPDIIRYFMTIPEAAGLVIQAGVMGQEGEIFILDMGEPVKIKDLAEDMIRFAGLVPHQDIEIRYIGLRPGEKLFEELLLDGEGIQPTRHEKIHIALSHNVNLQTLTQQIEELNKVASAAPRSLIDSMIGSLLAEYKPVFGGSQKPSRSHVSDPL